MSLVRHQDLTSSNSYKYTCIHIYFYVLADGSLLKSTLIPTPSPPIHIALSCDSITLSVCLQENGMLKCYFYDTRNFAVKVRNKWNIFYTTAR